MQQLDDLDFVEAPATGAGSALADLQAIAKRSGDPALSSAARRVAWQIGHEASLRAAAEASLADVTQRLDTVTRQRDQIRAVSLQAADLPERIERQALEVKRALKAVADATASAMRCARPGNFCVPRTPSS